jgi:hypothetical protein
LIVHVIVHDPDSASLTRVRVKTRTSPSVSCGPARPARRASPSAALAVTAVVADGQFLGQHQVEEVQIALGMPSV